MRNHQGLGAQSGWRNRVGTAMSPVSCYSSLNIFPFALNVYPGRFLHFLKSFGLFFRCSNADATTSALGMSGSLATEKHVDLLGCDIRRTNSWPTRKFLRPALTQ